MGGQAVFILPEAQPTARQSGMFWHGGMATRARADRRLKSDTDQNA